LATDTSSNRESEVHPEFLDRRTGVYWEAKILCDQPKDIRVRPHRSCLIIGNAQAAIRSEPFHDFPHDSNQPSGNLLGILPVCRG
jgi:hypothetical protein